MTCPARTVWPSSGPTITTLPGTWKPTSTVVFAWTMPLAVVDQARVDGATSRATTGIAVESPSFGDRADAGAHAVSATRVSVLTEAATTVTRELMVPPEGLTTVPQLTALTSRAKKRCSTRVTKPSSGARRALLPARAARRAR